MSLDDFFCLESMIITVFFLIGRTFAKNLQFDRTNERRDRTCLMSLAHVHCVFPFTLAAKQIDRGSQRALRCLKPQTGRHFRPILLSSEPTADAVEATDGRS